MAFDIYDETRRVGLINLSSCAPESICLNTILHNYIMILYTRIINYYFIYITIIMYCIVYR